MPMKTDCLKAATTLEAAGGQRRQTPRYSCVASAVAVDVRSQARVTGRTSVLGRGGCYLETITPFPSGTRVWIRITKEDARSVVHFATRAVVLYATPGAGMGVTFTSIPSGKSPVLDEWLAELNGGAATVEVEDSEAILDPEPRNASRGAFSELITTLERKGILTPTEAKAILSK
jgi:hypothetical protein